MRSSLLLITGALMFAGAYGDASAERLSAKADVFDTLFDNVWYLPTSDRAATLYVTSLGSGPDVVVLHGGSGGDFNYLVDAVRPLAGHHRFILFDQRGSALSPVTDAAIKSITIDKLVDDLETLRLALQQPKIVLFAHSAGTLLAMYYFKKYPDHVAAMILTGSFTPKTPEGGISALVKQGRARARALMARPAVAALLKREGLDGDPAAMTPQQRSARSRIVGFADFDLVHVDRWRQLQGGGVFYNSAVDDAIGDSLPANYDITPVWHSHPIPISVIQGDEDYADPGASGWNGTGANVQVIPTASHIAWIDNPVVFTKALRNALIRSDKANPGAAVAAKAPTSK